ncbi:hypothetical protein H0H93_002634 [Arthromyces matolae]|nr:hypothetical protein H0H93_002634 [Arthromyces matolae]
MEETNIHTSQSHAPGNQSHEHANAPGSSSLSTTRIISHKIQINRTTTLGTLYTYPHSTLVEYPETGTDGHKVGHLFYLDPDPANRHNPCNAFAYSRGRPDGKSPAGKRLYCELLKDGEGNKVPCRETHATCQGLKVCPYADKDELCTPHTSASRDQLCAQLQHEMTHSEFSPNRSLREKTLAFYVAVQTHGCGAPPFETTSTQHNHERSSLVRQKNRASRGHIRKSTCDGNITLETLPNGKIYIRCEHYNIHTNRDHLINYEAGGGLYDTAYLTALFWNDTLQLKIIEESDATEGYGPLVSCSTVYNVTQNKVMCPSVHRNSAGDLEYAEMQHLPCAAKFKVYEPLPEYQAKCARILVICQGEHAHPIPIPTKTPPGIRTLLFELFERLDDDLADLTPRRLLRHPIAIDFLRSQRPDISNPSFVDLHSSLANRDHIRSYITQAQDTYFPLGTGWQGEVYDLYSQRLFAKVRFSAVIDLKSKQDMDLDTPPYIRFIEEVLDLDGDEADDVTGDPFRVIICMFPDSSVRLRNSKFVQCDIGFKRIVGFEEFELGGLDADTRTSIVYCRIYLNRQTATAHQYIFKKIDQIVLHDTGSSLKWRHLHARSLDDDYTGILQLTADQHGGQAKGFGLYLVSIAQTLTGKHDLHEPHRLLSDLSPYDHLRRIFRLCAVHVMRNIKTTKVSDVVKERMRSLICVEHPNWNTTLTEIIRDGGKAGNDWVQDKLRSQFAFAGICWEKSYIPREIWQIGDSNSNIIEGLHADVNREGISCSLLGGVCKGRRYDLFKLKTLKVHNITSIRPSYSHNHPIDSTARKLRRKAQSRHKSLQSEDNNIETKNQRLQSAYQTQAQAQRRLEAAGYSAHQAQSSNHGVVEKAAKSYQKASEGYARAVSDSLAMVGTGSGKVGLLLPRSVIRKDSTL